MVIDDLAIAVRVTQRSEIAGLKGLHAVGCVLGYVAAVKDRVIHYQQASAAARIWIGRDPYSIYDIEITIGADR
jgi:hypothetical protein